MFLVIFSLMLHSAIIPLASKLIWQITPLASVSYVLVLAAHNNADVFTETARLHIATNLP